MNHLVDWYWDLNPSNMRMPPLLMMPLPLPLLPLPPLPLPLLPLLPSLPYFK
jgi:hypothetical protein